jgi:hypothetical protein
LVGLYKLIANKMEYTDFPEHGFGSGLLMPKSSRFGTPERLRAKCANEDEPSVTPRASRVRPTLLQRSPVSVADSSVSKSSDNSSLSSQSSIVNLAPDDVQFFSVRSRDSDSKKLEACRLAFSSQSYYLRKSNSRHPHMVFPLWDSEDWTNSERFANKLTSFMKHSSSQELVTQILDILNLSIDTYSSKSNLLKVFLFDRLLKDHDFTGEKITTQLKVLHSLEKMIRVKTPFDDDQGFLYIHLFRKNVFNWLNELKNSPDFVEYKKEKNCHRTQLISVFSGLADRDGVAKKKDVFSQSKNLIEFMKYKNLSDEERESILSGIRGEMAGKYTARDFCSTTVHDFLIESWALYKERGFDQGREQVLSTIYSLVVGNLFDMNSSWNIDGLTYFATEEIRDLIIDIIGGDSFNFLNDEMGLANGESNGGVALHITLAFIQCTDHGSNLFRAGELDIIFRSLLFPKDYHEEPLDNFLDILKQYVGDGALGSPISESSSIIKSARKVLTPRYSSNFSSKHNYFLTELQNL